MIVLLGATCTGKSTVLNKLIDDYGYKRVVTTTTRPMREGEIDGTDYHFIDEHWFKYYIEQDEFEEYTSYNVANGQTWYYGTMKDDLYKNYDESVLIVNPDGYKHYCKYIPDAFFVRLYAPLDVIRKRLTDRNDDPAEAERRILADCNDFNLIRNSDMNMNINTHLYKPEEIAQRIHEEYQKYGK